jgi:tripeptidyl-peptidase-1
VWHVADGQNDQSLDKVGPEANLDTQFGFGLSFPTPGTFYSTAGSPPFNPDLKTQSNTNEPYDDVRDVISPIFCEVC